MSRYSSGDGSGAVLVFEAVFFLGCLAVTITKCGAQLSSNRDNIDMEKAFDYLIDYKGEGVSITKIDHYSDYTGQTSEFVTQDGLHVLTGLTDAELVNVNSYEEAYNRALELSGGREDQITSYDQIRGLNHNPETDSSWNKVYFNLNYDFDYAIAESDEGVTVRNIQTWRDWDDDDKVQYLDMDGILYLSSYDNTTLINSAVSNAEGESIPLPDAVYDYALSLAGSEDRLYGDVDKEEGKVLVKKPKYQPSTDSSSTDSPY